MAHRCRGAAQLNSLASHDMIRAISLILCMALLSGCRATPPAQDELAKTFAANRQGYEILKDMVLADRLIAVASHGKEFARKPYIFEAPAVVGIPAARAMEYRRLMLAADVQRVDVTDDGDVFISMASWGTANRGWRVSAMWRSMPPESLLPTLDAFKKTSGDWQTGYSRAAERWYFRIVW
jgi:hypothetical protein